MKRRRLGPLADRSGITYFSDEKRGEATIRSCVRACNNRRLVSGSKPDCVNRDGRVHDLNQSWAFAADVTTPVNFRHYRPTTPARYIWVASLRVEVFDTGQAMRNTCACMCVCTSSPPISHVRANTNYKSLSTQCVYASAAVQAFARVYTSIWCLFIKPQVNPGCTYGINKLPTFAPECGQEHIRIVYAHFPRGARRTRSPDGTYDWGMQHRESRDQQNNWYRNQYFWYLVEPDRNQSSAKNIQRFQDNKQTSSRHKVSVKSR